MESEEAAYQDLESAESMKREEKTGIAYTPSVSSLQSNVEAGTPVSSMDLVQALARRHLEYANNKFEKVAHETYEPEAFTPKPVEEWFLEVEQLFDPEKVPELHGRLFALGLCELDPELKTAFENSGVLAALHEELREEFNSLLKVGRGPGDPAVLHLDSDSKVDHLGRDGFVEALATWLNRFWQRSNPTGDKNHEHSFMVHLHGPWGSGKSTLLNLLEQKLSPSDRKKKKEQEKKQAPDMQWMVIHFNAWQHSHVEPVWWPLLHQLYKESRKNLKSTNEKRKARAVWWYDFYWKLISGNKSAGYWFVLFLVLLVFITLANAWSGDTENGDFLSSETIDAVVQLVTLAGTVVAGFLYFFRSLMWGSADSAQDYLKMNQDPLEKIKDYFREIVKRIDHPVIIYIDDLDRCPSSYVVDLLESLQTLFNDSRVFYVLAADRRWLYGSFEERYREFRKHIEEPGKQIGYLFLDKLFQLSISVPQITPEMQESYLNYLYFGEKQGERDLEKVRREAREEFKRITSESELIRTLGRREDRAEDQIRREEAVRASAKVEIEAGTEYFLKQFAHLLEPNPRSIKRLVNNYGIYRAIIILSDPSVIDTVEKRKKFALWNIVAMRWPMIAEYMEDDRNQISAIVEGSANNIVQEEIKELITMREVQNVFKGKKIDTSLDADYVKQILSLQAAPA